jgi:hypothetical protein
VIDLTETPVAIFLSRTQPYHSRGPLPNAACRCQPGPESENLIPNSLYYFLFPDLRDRPPIVDLQLLRITPWVAHLNFGSEKEKAR